MSNSSSNPGCNISFGGINLLTVAFVVLKLCGVIDWSWWWVLAPSWIPFILALVVGIVIILVGAFTNNRYRY